MFQTIAAALLALAPALAPADAGRVLDEVRRPGARAVLVNVWATWCTPCREEMPDLVRLHRDWADRGFRLVLVSGDFEEDAEAAREFLGSVGVDFPTLLKTQADMPFIDGLDERWSGALPATFLYDGNGKLVDSWEGKADAATLRSKVARVLEAAPPPDEKERR
jgi:thiol-disulfide isomerase/thioredoxin